MKLLKKYWLSLVIIALCIVADIITKLIITNNTEWTANDSGKIINVKSIEVIEGFFNITYARNTGAGWSILSDSRIFLLIITFIAFGVFVYLLKDIDFKKHRYYSIGISLMVGGTIGNFIERLGKGYVTDFLDFIIFGYDFPIFNVADMCLVAGAIGLLISILLTKENVFEFKKSSSPLDNQVDVENDNSSEVDKENND